MLRLVRVALVTVVAFAGLAFSGPAVAVSCVTTNPFTHYFAMFFKASAAKNAGLYSDVYVPESGVADYSSGGHINGTIWEAVDNATDTTQHWVEAGWSHGWNYTPDYTYYWARDTSQHGYAQHKITNVSLTVDTWMPLEIVYAGNSNWQVYIDEKLGYDSDGGEYANIDADPYSYGYSGGIESTSDSSWAGTGYWASLEDQQGGSWTSSISSGSTLYCAPPSSSSWVTANVKLKADF